jgi:hypothetical protein
MSLQITEETLKLLNGMREKVISNIVETVIVQDNTVNAISIQFQDEIMAQRTVFYIKFALNGKTYTTKSHIDNSDWNDKVRSVSKEHGAKIVADLLIQTFSKAVAEELIKQSPNFYRSLFSKKI